MINMGNTFFVDEVEYKIVRNPYTAGPMIARVDGLPIENRKEICRRFLRKHGWTDDMFYNKITNDLERNINKIINGSFVPNEVGTPNPYRKERSDSSVHVSSNHRAKRREDVPEPSEEQVEYWLKSWDELEDYVAQEEAIDKLFYGEFNSNDVLQNILIKCSVLNDFYSTNIFKIYPVAKHILELNIDERLKAGDPTLVDDIARININDKEKNFYSFASKYCSHHNQLEFPIYDSYVHKVLKYFRNVDRFFDFDEADLKVYPKFKNILIEFRKFYHLDRFNLKELDKYLWQFGKKYFPKNY